MTKQTDSKILSDHGVHLEHVNNVRHCSSLHYGKNVVIEQDTEGRDIVVSIGSKCPKCKMRVRGLNHVNGSHHRGVAHKHSR